MTTTEETSQTIPPARNHFATHGHHRLAYEVIPAARDEPGESSPTLVLLHGLLLGRAEFATLRDLLRGRVTLVLPDARGHGASAAIPDLRYSIRTAASELDAILEATAGDVHLLGRDFGGAVALDYATVRPARIRSLTLIDPALPNLSGIDDTDGALAESRRTDARAADFAYKGVTDRAVDLYLAPRIGSEWRTSVPKPLIGTFRRHGTALAGCLTAISGYTADPAKLGKHAIPTRVLTTATAHPVSRRMNAALAELIPAATLSDLPSGDPSAAPWLALDGAAAQAIIAMFDWLPVTD